MKKFFVEKRGGEKKGRPRSGEEKKKMQKPEI